MVDGERKDGLGEREKEELEKKGAWLAYQGGSFP